MDESQTLSQHGTFHVRLGSAYSAKDPGMNAGVSQPAGGVPAPTMWQSLASVLVRVGEERCP